MSYYVKLSKTVDTVTAPLISYRLKLSVSEAVGVPTALFVHKYVPTSPYSGNIAFEFYNVAYPDELESISDTIQNPRTACYIRRTAVDKTFSSFDDMSEFIDCVTKDIKRLVSHLEDFDSNKESSFEDITITRESINRTPSDKSDDDSVQVNTKQVSKPAPIDELTTTPCDTIIVGVDGR